MDPVLFQDPNFKKLHQQFRTKIDLGIELLVAAIEHKVPFSVLLFDSWYLADELVSIARYHKKDWISLLRRTGIWRLTALSSRRQQANPSGRDKTYWTFTLAVRLPELGKVRLVVSFKSAELTGTSVVLVTNCVEWGVQRIIALYLRKRSQGVKFISP